VSINFVLYESNGTLQSDLIKGKVKVKGKGKVNPRTGLEGPVG